MIPNIYDYCSTCQFEAHSDAHSDKSINTTSSLLFVVGRRGAAAAADSEEEEDSNVKSGGSGRRLCFMARYDDTKAVAA